MNLCQVNQSGLCVNHTCLYVSGVGAFNKALANISVCLFANGFLSVLGVWVLPIRPLPRGGQLKMP